MSKLNRLKKLPGAVSTVKTNRVKVEGLTELLEELKAKSSAKDNSQQKILEAIEQLIRSLVSTKPQNTDTSEIVKAIKQLKMEVINNTLPPVDYRVDFERDKNNLMKTGIKLTAMPQ